MSSAVASIILAFYHLVGISHGPYQTNFEQSIIKGHPQAALEVNLPVPKQALPVALSNEPLTLAAASAYAVDAETFAPLYSLNPDKPLPIASLTKIATALVLLKDHSASQIIQVPNLPGYSSQDAQLHISTGEQFRFDQLFAGALIPSANDAADALAISASGNLAGFSTNMNQLIADWGIDNTHYSNPSGLTDNDNFASARALARLAKIGLANPLFAQFTATAHANISDLAGRSFDLKTTNELLGIDPRISGIKTGFTPAAGQCFVGLATIKGRRVITVILGSPDRFGETKQLLDWIERNWDWK